jgi:hypothetical protein
MTETFIRIAAGHYRNVGTGVEIVKVSADEAGQRGWHVTTPTVGGFEVVAIGATMREVRDAYVQAVRAMYAVIGEAYGKAVTEQIDRTEARAEAAGISTWRAEAARRMATYDHPSWAKSVLAEVRRLDEWIAYEATVEREVDEDEAWAASDTTWRQTTEQAHAEALALNEGRSARNAEDSWAERIRAFALDQGWSGPTGYVRAEKWLIAKDRDEALALNEARSPRTDTQDSEDDDLIHLWTGTRAPSACGVDIWTTPYTFGSPVLAEVTCDACKDRYSTRWAELTAELGKFVRGEEPYAYPSAEPESCTCDSPSQQMYPHAAHREALGGFRENGEPVWFEGRTWTVEHVAIGVGGRTCLTLEVDDAAGPYEVRNVYADDVLADNYAEADPDRVDGSPECSPECLMPRAADADQGHLADCPAKAYLVAKQDAARVIAEARAPQGSTGPGIPEVPADLDDDAAWAAYCTALPPATDQQIADVLAEYGDPYAALRAEAVEAYKLAARSIWKIQAHAPRDQMTELHAGLIVSLRSQMRTLRGVIEIYDMLTESWRVSVRTGADRDAATQTF